MRALYGLSPFEEEVTTVADTHVTELGGELLKALAATTLWLVFTHGGTATNPSCGASREVTTPPFPDVILIMGDVPLLRYPLCLVQLPLPLSLVRRVTRPQ